MSDDLRRAKHIRYMMTNRAYMGDSEEVDKISNASFEASVRKNMETHDPDTPESGSDREDLIPSSMYNYAPTTGPWTPPLSQPSPPQPTPPLHQQSNTVSPTITPPRPLASQRRTSFNEPAGLGDN